MIDAPAATNAMNGWIEDFAARAAPLLAAGLDRLLSGHDPEEIVGIGLTTDSDYVSLQLAANTRTHLEAVSGPDADPGYYRWAIGEWDLRDHESLATLDDELRRTRDAVDDGLHGERTVYYAVVTAALHRTMLLVADSGALRRWPHAVVNIWPYDNWDPEQEGLWVRSLNTPEAISDYEGWLQRETRETRE